MGNYLFFISKEVRFELSLQSAGLACTGPWQWKGQKIRNPRSFLAMYTVLKNLL